MSIEVIEQEQPCDRFNPYQLKRIRVRLTRRLRKAEEEKDQGRAEKILNEIRAHGLNDDDDPTKWTEDVLYSYLFEMGFSRNSRSRLDYEEAMESLFSIYPGFRLMEGDDTYCHCLTERIKSYLNI